MSSSANPPEKSSAIQKTTTEKKKEKVKEKTLASPETTKHVKEMTLTAFRLRRAKKPSKL
jgi:hypothetical protein